MKKVLILGGQGRVGWQVAQDITRHNQVEVIITGKSLKRSLNYTTIRFLSLALQDQEQVKQAIEKKDLVIDCIGPFHQRDAQVLNNCISLGVNYIDISDHSSFSQKLLPYHSSAQKAGIIGILNTGIFPGISNSMVRQGIECLDQAENIHLSYVVGGSGGAGITVMKTTFLGLKESFKAYIAGEWQEKQPYSEREEIDFASPYGQVGVYWFPMPETTSLVESFPVKTVITKFGVVPDIYNYLIALVAQRFPHSWLTNNQIIEFLAKVSYAMTSITDPYSGIGVAIRVYIEGEKAGKPLAYLGKMYYKETAQAAGIGAGIVAQLILEGEITKPGLYRVEEIIPTSLFEKMMQSRNVLIEKRLENILKF